MSPDVELVPIINRLTARRPKTFLFATLIACFGFLGLEVGSKSYVNL